MTTRRSLVWIFAAPFAVTVLGIAGLVSALVGDGGWDAFSWFGLGLPVLIYLCCLGWPRRK